MPGLPEPPIPPECSMAGNDWFPLHFDRLRKSKWWRRASDLARARNVMLWGEAYKQVPAGSMPDDDDELAEAAGFGMDVESFIAVKDEIMAPWLLCADGRWYHPTVCEVVLEAWERASERRRKDAERKAAQRARVKGHTRPAHHVTPADDDVTRDIHTVTRDAPVVTADFGTHNRQDRQDTTSPVASNATGHDKPKVEPWDRDEAFGKLWAATPPDMRKRAKSKANVWPEWRKALKHADQEAIVRGLIRYKALDADVARTGGPGLHIWLKARTWEQWTAAEAPERIGDDWPDTRWEAALFLWRNDGTWDARLGPEPGQPGCRVPPHLQRSEPSTLRVVGGAG